MADTSPKAASPSSGRASPAKTPPKSAAGGSSPPAAAAEPTQAPAGTGFLEADVSVYGGSIRYRAVCRLTPS